KPATTYIECRRAQSATEVTDGPSSGSATVGMCSAGRPAAVKASGKTARAEPDSPAASSNDNPRSRVSAGSGCRRLNGGEVSSSVANEVVAILTIRFMDLLSSSVLIGFITAER